MKKLVYAAAALVLGLGAAWGDTAPVGVTIMPYCTLTVQDAISIHVTGPYAPGAPGELIPTPKSPSGYITNQEWFASGNSGAVPVSAMANFPYSVTMSNFVAPLLGGAAPSLGANGSWNWVFDNGLTSFTGGSGATVSHTMQLSARLPLHAGSGHWTGGSLTFTVAHQ